jgi:hypothetical protein
VLGKRRKRRPGEQWERARQDLYRGLDAWQQADETIYAALCRLRELHEPLLAKDEWHREVAGDDWDEWLRSLVILMLNEELDFASLSRSRILIPRDEPEETRRPASDAYLRSRIDRIDRLLREREREATETSPPADKAEGQQEGDRPLV